VVLIGSDTPQIQPPTVRHALSVLASGRTRSVVGRTVDGGFWCVGVRDPLRGLFRDVDMTTDECARLLLRRLSELGLQPLVLNDVIRDVDDFADARLVAREVHASRFSQAVAALVAADASRRFAVGAGGPPYEPSTERSGTPDVLARSRGT
jgi:hypothetical protein